MSIISRLKPFLLPALLIFCLLTTQAARSDDPGAKTKPLRFVVYGDTRDGNAMHKKLVALILKQKPDFVIQTGDVVSNADDPAQWKIYDEITGAMRKQIPVYPARGNHDVGGPGYEARVTAPFTSGNKLYYSFDKANCHFIALDNFSPLSPDTEQYHWLEKDLAAAQQRGKILFATFHVPPYGIGWHGSDLGVRQTLCPIFIKYGVRAVFNGHDHNYYRTLRDGVTYITSGGGGATPFPLDPRKGAIPGDRWALAFHIVVCDVEGDKVKLTALRFDNKVFDECTLSKPDR